MYIFFINKWQLKPKINELRLIANISKHKFHDITSLWMQYLKKYTYYMYDLE